MALFGSLRLSFLLVSEWGKEVLTESGKQMTTESGIQMTTESGIQLTTGSGIQLSCGSGIQLECASGIQFGSGLGNLFAPLFRSLRDNPWWAWPDGWWGLSDTWNWGWACAALRWAADNCQSIGGVSARLPPESCRGSTVGLNLFVSFLFYSIFVRHVVIYIIYIYSLFIFLFVFIKMIFSLHLYNYIKNVTEVTFVTQNG